MRERNNFISKIEPKAIIMRMLLGAAIGFVIISFFVFSVNDPKPEWGKFWRVRPIIITPLASAFGILCFYLKDFISPKSNTFTAILIFLSTIAFIITLWLGIVLGLDGTLWN